MPVVPIRQQDLGPAPAPPLEQKYLLMAAAQMHSEGRLIKPNSDPQIPMTTQDEEDLIKGPLTGVGSEEWERQHQSDVRSDFHDEPPQPDQTNDIMRHLGIAKKQEELLRARGNAVMFGAGRHGNMPGGQDI